MGETEQNNNSLFVHANGTSGQGTQNQYLTFMLGDGLFALSIVSIREIIDYGNLAETLQLPECGQAAWCRHSGYRPQRALL